MSIVLDRLYKGGINDKPPKEKPCCDCKQVKPLAMFKKSYKNRDGRHSRCRECEKKRIDSQKVQEAISGFFKHDKYYS